jgi:hypothetical protein
VLLFQSLHRLSRHEGQDEQLARYEFRGDSGVAAAHYKAALGRKAYALLKDGAGTAGRHVLVFGSGEAYATVALRKNSPEAVAVIIVLTVVAPAETGKDNKR